MARHLLINLVIWPAVALAGAAVFDAAAFSAPSGKAVLMDDGAFAASDGSAFGAQPGLTSRPVAFHAQRPLRSAFAAIAERPLFTPGRRPPAAPEAAPDSVGPTPLLGLAGVVGLEGARLALMRDVAGETLRLREGASVEGWTVVRIEPRSVTLRGVGGEHVVRLGDAPDEVAPDPAQGARRELTQGRRIPHAATAQGGFHTGFAGGDFDYDE